MIQSFDYEFPESGVSFDRLLIGSIAMAAMHERVYFFMVCKVHSLELFTVSTWVEKIHTVGW